MEQTYFQKKSEVVDYQIVDKSFRIEVSKDVFPPSDWARKLMELLRIEQGSKIIDIGTGAGVIAVYAALSGNEIYATDISSKAIAQTKKNAMLNGVSINCSVGSLFADYDTLFDMIVVNLPQEIIPEGYLTSEELILTIRGGDKGNETVMKFLKEAPRYMHKNSRIIMPICSLSNYVETFKYLSQFYQVQLLGIFNIKAKEFVEGHLDMYLDLNKEGIIKIFKNEENWYHLLYVVELKTKPCQYAVN